MKIVNYKILNLHVIRCQLSTDKHHGYIENFSLRKVIAVKLKFGKMNDICDWFWLFNNEFVMR